MKEKKILIIGYVWPEPNSSAAGSRMMQLIALFKQQGAVVIFGSPAKKTRFTVNLNDFGIEELKLELNNSSFDDQIRTLQPYMVIFDRFMMEEQFGWRVAEYCPDAIRVLDTEDLHGLRKARHIALKEHRSFEYKDLYNDIAKREIASIFRSDLSLIISKAEMKLLVEFFKVPSELLYYLPFLTEPLSEEKIKQQAVYHERKHFITIGNFLHPPNWDSVLYLKREIWPLIKEQLPDAEMHIYGAYTPSKAQQLHNPKERFYIKERADNVNEVMEKAKVCLSPLRFGAGLKGKFIDAMQNGTPIITTSTGAEGMYDGSNWSGIIADTANDIVTAAVKLYTSETEWRKAQQRGYEILNDHFDKQKLGDQFIEQLKISTTQIEEYRQQNFIGAMLRHQNLNSTKYMAKWIEEKNKKLKTI